MSSASPAFTDDQWRLMSELLQQRRGASGALDSIEVDVAATPDAERTCRTAAGTFRGQFFPAGGDEDETARPRRAGRRPARGAPAR